MSDVERAALIQWICVRKAHRKMTPVDPSTPVNIHDDGRWAFCPAGLPEDADHLWYATGGVTRAALGRFKWPSEAEVAEAKQ